jgi:hypothetical protein
VVRLHEEADQHGVPLGPLEETQALDTGLRGVAGEGFLEIVVEPMVLVAAKLHSNIDILQTKRSNREGYEASSVGL